jgi:2-desacetyl-2-hydroxyethyl bacteriochlorophyllide A dehydrogenase
MAEYFTAPAEYLVRINQDIPPESAAVIEPLAISAHAVKRCAPSMGAPLLVIGAGPIGLGAAEIGRTLGSHVILAETNSARRDFARTVFGCRNVLDPLDADFIRDLKKIAGGDMPGHIIDSTGNGASMSQAVNYLAFGGRMVFVGFYPGDLTINDVVFHRKETELLGSRGATRAEFRYVIDCITENRINPSAFLSHRANFENAKEAFEKWVSLGGAVFKGLFVL